jgi:hypothetical protein
MIDTSIFIPEGWFIMTLIFSFGYMLSRKHSIQAVVNSVIFNDKQLFNNELVPKEDMKYPERPKPIQDPDTVNSTWDLFCECGHTKLHHYGVLIIHECKECMCPKYIRKDNRKVVERRI